MCLRSLWPHPDGMETPSTLSAFSTGLAEAVELGAKSVVAVNGRRRVPSSGILWRPDVVVTTDHNLKRDQDITVTLADGRVLSATLAGRDPGSDLAVLRLSEAGGEAAKTVSDASIKTGSLVLALGRRIENGLTATLGVINTISGAYRTWRGGQIDRFIRTDVRIYTGFSGGALIDPEGRIIGLNTSILARDAGITIPAATVSRVAEILLTRGRMGRGFIGVGMHPVRLPDGGIGLVILSIEPNGPAAQAGIVVGDVLLTLNGHAVRDTDDVQAQLGPDTVGKPITVGILRGGAPVDISVTPAERPTRGRG
jgi:S1-C subfamily serine protease